MIFVSQCGSAIWHKIRTAGELTVQRDWNFGFRENRIISCLPKRVLVSPENLSSTQQHTVLSTFCCFDWAALNHAHNTQTQVTLRLCGPSPNLQAKVCDVTCLLTANYANWTPEYPGTARPVAMRGLKHHTRSMKICTVKLSTKLQEKDVAKGNCRHYVHVLRDL